MNLHQVAQQLAELHAEHPLHSVHLPQHGGTDAEADARLGAEEAQPLRRVMSVFFAAVQPDPAATVEARVLSRAQGDMRFYAVHTDGLVFRWTVNGSARTFKAHTMVYDENIAVEGDLIFEVES